MPDPHTRGDLVARALSGSWRAEPPPCDLGPDDLTAVVATLLATGAAGLAWWCLSRGDRPRGEPGRALHDAFRLQTLDATLHERRLTRVVEILSGGGVDFVLAKGWAVARLYARPGLRPYGDIDVFVAPADEGRARDIVARHEEETLRVDLHVGVPLLRRPWGDLREGRSLVAVNGVTVPVLGAEDHLALLATHLFFHGAWRPTWLCDVAAFIEELPDGFDWDRFQDRTPRQREQCRAVVLLTTSLLGADSGHTPWAGESETLPRWLPAAVLRAWGAGGHYSVTTRIGLTEPRPRELVEAVRVRWPNPVEATFRWRAPINAFPRLPFQLMDVAARGARLLVGR